MLKDKCAIVTGGNKGIGKAIAIKLASLGTKVVINYSKDEEGAKEVLENIRIFGGEAYIFKGDVSNSKEALDLINYCKNTLGSIDILINNAGITKDGLILRMKEEDFDKVIDINLKGTFNCIKHSTPMFLKKKDGVIVNISSIVGLYGNAGQCNYAASKAGIIGLTKSLAKELGGKNIRVNSIAPGFIDTDMTKALSQDIREKMKENIALKRLGKPEDIAEVVAFLCSSGGSYITGEVIAVDGGMMM